MATERGIWQRTDGDLVRWEALPAQAGLVLTMRPTTPDPVFVRDPESPAEDDPGEPTAEDPVPPEPPEVTISPRSTARPMAIGLADALHFAATPARSRSVPVAGSPLVGVRMIARRDAALLVAASAQGPYESTDGGVTWQPLRRGLGEGASHAVAIRAGQVLLATANGLYTLAPAPPPQAQILRLKPWVPLGALIDATLRRRSLTRKLGSRAVAAALPQVSVTYEHRTDLSTRWDADTWTTIEDQTDWGVFLRLTWRPNRQPVAGAFDFQPGDGVTAFVVDDEVVIDDGTSPNVLFARVNRGLVRYRDQLTEQVTQLYRERQRLALEKLRFRDDELLRQVNRELRLAEVDARLDALTNSAVSRWAAAQTDPIP